MGRSARFEELRPSIVEAGALPALVGQFKLTLLPRSPSWPQLVSACSTALAAIRLLVLREAVHARSCVAAGTVPPLLAALSSASGTEPAAEAAQLMTNLLVATKDRALAEEAARDPSSIAAILGQGGDSSLRAGALLHAIFVMLPARRGAFVAAGVVPLLVSGLEGGGEEVQVEQLLMTLEHLCKGSSVLMDLVLDAGALKPILACLRRSNSSGAIRSCAVSTLAAMLPAASKAHREQAMAAGAARLLADQFSHGLARPAFDGLQVSREEGLAQLH